MGRIVTQLSVYNHLPILKLFCHSLNGTCRYKQSAENHILVKKFTKSFECIFNVISLITRGQTFQRHYKMVDSRNVALDVVTGYWLFCCISSPIPRWVSYQIRKIGVCACAGNAGNIFPSHRGSANPTCITARAWCTCHDACRNRKLAICFEVGVGGNVPSIPGACATRNFTYLVRGPWHNAMLRNKSIVTYSAAR